MRRPLKFIFSVFFFFNILINCASGQELLQHLQKKFGNENVVYKDSSAFREFYEIKFRQPLDHSDLSRGSFIQLIYLGHNHTDSMLVIETNGYEMLPYQDKKYVAEPAKILNANQLVVEHRYYGTSKPDSNDRTFLNMKQITSDYHAIRMLLGDIYKSDWVSTGVSKGGICALNYSYYYPEDIKASFVYVAPIIEGVEDERMTAFLSEKRSTKDGKRLFEIQQHLLMRKPHLLPVFSEILELSDMKLGNADLEKIYDFAVLEFDFNYWQYITGYDKMLDLNRSTLESLKGSGFKSSSVLISEEDSMIALFPMCVWFLLDPDISDPFFYQAYTELGSYGYEEELFTGLKNKKYSTEYLAGKHPGYSVEYVEKFNDFLKKDLERTIFIYGAEDPWTSCKPEISSTGDNLMIINPGTNHSTQIKDLSEEDKNRIEEKINRWLNVQVNLTSKKE